MTSIPTSAGTASRIPFGQMAVRKGYCTAAQVEQTLRMQEQLGQGGRPRPLIGVLMVRNGTISTGQLISILRAYEDDPPA